MMLTSSLSAQTEPVRKKYTISGHIKDSKTGEAMIGATIMLKEMPQIGTVSNAYGFYSLTVSEGTYTMITRFMGYTPFSQQVVMKQNVKLNIELLEKGVEQKTVVVTGEKKDENIKEIQMGMEKLDVKSIQDIPVLFGEKDVIKTVQLLPGVKSGGDGNTGFYVRGGAADQNLILLDEATVYSA
jgi:hypothetical protein